MNITCISCPIGCRMNVEVKGTEILSIEGNACPRGLKYAKQEAIAPQRMLTAVIKLENSSTPLSLKTSDTVPKNKIFNCMHSINALKISAPVHIGDVILQNVCNTGVDIIATKSVLL